MTVDDLCSISQLAAVWESLAEEMALCACDGPSRDDLCPRCESLASVVGAILDLIPRLWQEDPDA